ncbi:MAG TPA: aminotransferase class IV, partial [bacterium]|nr:aminotransferase class IV [bacterium]
LMGDGVWEGLRVVNGRVAFLDRHLARLFEGAKAIDLDVGMSGPELTAALDETLAANGMKDGVHIRLMVTRGLKATPYQDPRVNVGGPTIVIVPEHKEALPEIKERGVRLATVHVRRGPPDVQDPKLNSHSKLNCITACIQAAKAGADEGLMLDPRGFVATCNSTNFFIVRDGEVWTSTPNWCMNGITRAVTLELCGENGISARETDFSLTQVYGADEAFVTGTFAGQVPVREVDGRTIGGGGRGPVTARLQELYAERIRRECGG